MYGERLEFGYFTKEEKRKKKRYHDDGDDEEERNFSKVNRQEQIKKNNI